MTLRLLTWALTETGGRKGQIHYCSGFGNRFHVNRQDIVRRSPLAHRGSMNNPCQKNPDCGLQHKYLLHRLLELALKESSPRRGHAWAVVVLVPPRDFGAENSRKARRVAAITVAAAPKESKCLADGHQLSYKSLGCCGCLRCTSATINRAGLNS